MIIYSCTFPLLLLAQKGVTISVFDSHTSALWGALNYKVSQITPIDIVTPADALD
jgi:hypothetical protein